MRTLSEILSVLQSKGICQSFTMDDHGVGLVNPKSGKVYSSFELQLLSSYTFMSADDNDASGVVYVVGTYDGAIGYYISFKEDAENLSPNNMTLMYRNDGIVKRGCAA